MHNYVSMQTQINYMHTIQNGQQNNTNPLRLFKEP